jgi:hypothetical protein
MPQTMFVALSDTRASELTHVSEGDGYFRKILVKESTPSQSVVWSPSRYSKRIVASAYILWQSKHPELSAVGAAKGDGATRMIDF